MSRCLAVLVSCVALGALPAAPSGAVLCTPDPVPAATLLLPYFELDTRDFAKPKPKRETTRLTLVNMEASAILARVTLWTDLSVPTLAFDVYMTGFDVEEVDLFDVFRGKLPVAFVCTKGEPAASELSAEQVEALRLAHAGLPVPANGGLCSGVPHGDTRLRGYATVDNVVECIASGRPVFPSDPGYFGDGGVAVNDNVLAGQYLVQSKKPKLAESARLVAIEASEATFEPGDATFYGRHVAYSGADAREPLPGAWGVRYLNDLLAKTGTDLVVWRNAEAVQGPFACEALGSSGWYPEGHELTFAFDDQENPTEITGTVFPAETNRVAIGGTALPIAATRGWLRLDLGASGERRQSHVTARLRQGGASLQSFVEAAPLGEPCGAAPAPAPPIPPPVLEMQRPR
jgi:hypothetical protein